MDYKIDTKEKFHVITPKISVLTAIMAAELVVAIQELLKSGPQNIIVHAESIATAEIEGLTVLAALKESLYANQQSFVLCCCNTAVKAIIEQNALEEQLNLTPTESEAWDIVQMDEIEREFLADFDESAE